MKPVVILLALVATAHAWPGGANWYWPAQGDDSVMYGGTPGGGGILGTGGQHDHGIKCADCHIDRATENFTFGFQWSPNLPSLTTYVPGQQYIVTAVMTGANLACASGPNGGGSAADKIRNFAASFETDAGTPAGTLVSDANQTAPNCKLPPPAQMPPAGTTLLDGDCAVIFAAGNTSPWTFKWTAPASGNVHVFWGAVDGNCDMMSMNDAVQNGSTTLAPAAFASPRTIVVLALWPLLALAQ